MMDMWVDRPCLYAIRSSEYSDRNKKQAAYQEIATAIGKPGNHNFFHACSTVFGQLASLV